MPRRAHAGALRAYLVEHYRPGQQVDELRRSAAGARDAVAELQRQGEPVRFVCSTIVPRDEAFLCVVEAISEHLVREAYTRAGLSFDRISAAIAEEG